MGITIKQTSVEVLPEGVYPATITKIEPTLGQFGPQLKFQFELAEPEGKTLMGWCSQSFNPKSKLCGWARAAFGGRDIPAGWDLDCDKLLNKQVLLVVAKVKGSDGTDFNKIKDLLPVHQGRPQARQGGEGVYHTHGEHRYTVTVRTGAQRAATGDEHAGCCRCRAVRLVGRRAEPSRRRLVLRVG